MEDILIWGYCILSAIVTNIRQFIADFQIEPFYNKSKDDWIDHCPSITYDADGGIFSMKKCPPIYPELNVQLHQNVLHIKLMNNMKIC